VNTQGLVPYSVIIPVYNGARHIRRALESVFAQTAPPDEVLVVDDGSQDGSDELARDMDPRVIVHRHDRNRGPSEARNTGIHCSRNEIIAFLDSDDWWIPGKMDQQLALFALQPDLIAVFSDFQMSDPHGNVIAFQNVTLDQLSSFGLSLERLENDAYVVNGSVTHALISQMSFILPSSVVVKRSAFNRAGFFDPSYLIGEDLDMWIRLSLAGSIGYVDNRLVTKEKRATSLSHKEVKAAEDITRLYAGLPSRLPNLPDSVKHHIRGFLKRQYDGLGWHSRDKGDLAKSRHYYRLSLQQRFTLRTLACLARSCLEELTPWIGAH